MKHFIQLFVLIPFISFAQNSHSFYYNPAKPGKRAILDTSFLNLSNSASLGQFYLDVLQTKKTNDNILSDSLFTDKYNLKKIRDKVRVSCLFELKNQEYALTLEEKGMLFKTSKTLIHTGHIDIDSIHNFLSDTNFLTFKISQKVNTLMDSARIASAINLVQEDYITNQAYYGEDIIIGIIDAGFDYTHPNFFDESGIENYRIKRVWDQNLESGTPPENFFYGTELSSANGIFNAATDNMDDSHGTHVAGIAAGSGFGLGNNYSGVAPKAELVLVSYGYSVDKIKDAITYISEYADTENKPCVINMSLGTHDGPHDGTSSIDRFIDEISSEGKIIVGAAGNERNSRMHLKRTFTLENNTMYTLLTDINNQTNIETFGDIIIWGSKGADYEVAVNIYNENTNEIEGYTPYFSSKSLNSASYIIEDGDFFSDLCDVSFSAETNPTNKSDHVRVYIDNQSQDDNYRYAMLEIICYSGTVHAWTGSQERNIFNKSEINPSDFWEIGDFETTVGEIGGTAKEIISVGSYVTKNSYFNMNGNVQNNYAWIGDYSNFSSLGPTVDGRTKPDISAPGEQIVSSVNSFDYNYTISSSDVVNGISDGTKNWYYGAMTGTSMAAPLTAGIIALCLEAQPTLTSQEIKDLLLIYSLKDDYTGNDTPNNTWGMGKINAFNLLNFIESSVVGITESNTKMRIFPNPTNGDIYFNSKETGIYEIFNLKGKLVSSGTIIQGINEVEMLTLAQGAYNLKINIQNSLTVYKIIKQ